MNSDLDIIKSKISEQSISPTNQHEEEKIQTTHLQVEDY